MNSTHDLDTGPLTWVKGEIDLALARASEAVEAATRESDPAGKLQFAQTHLHQVRGALSIVGLDGLTSFTDGLDRYLSELARAERPFDGASAELVRRAMAAIGNYLDELSHGVADQALRLLPLLRELAAARGQGEPSPVELFYPDLGLRPPGKPGAAPGNAAKLLAERIRPLRSQFQAGLLGWLRKPAASEGPRAMGATCREIESLQSAPTARGMWRAAAALFDAIAEDQLDDPVVKQVCSHIDQQLKRMASGESSPSERLHREILYVLAIAPDTAPAAREMRETYRLDTLLPAPGASLCDQPLAPLLARLRSLFAAARDTWDHFAAGAAAALPQFEEDLNAALEASAPLGRPAFRHLLDTLAEVVLWLRKDPLRISEPVALEVASAIMLAETALETGRVPDANFTAQVARSEARLLALMDGRDPDAEDAATSALPDAAREAQERMALGQLAREMQVNLAHIEQTLDDYFRHPERKGALPALQGPLRQIEGVLAVLGEERALALLRDCGQRIRRLAELDGPAPEGEFEYLAHHLSAFGFFVQDLQGGKADIDRLLGGEPEAPRTEVPAPAAESEAPAAPEAEASPATEASAPPDRATPTVAAPAGAVASDDMAIDSELLEIFLEEGREVVATIADSLARSRANPHDVEVVTTIRRGFHTLKGSGRMVGLSDLGEAAWGLEQTLNRWLQLEWPPTPALHELIGAAQALFQEWVEQLAAGDGLWRDASAVLAEARRLRESEEPVESSALGEIPAEVPAAAGEQRADRTPARALLDAVPDLPAEADLELDLAADPLAEPIGAAATEPTAEALELSDIEGLLAPAAEPEDAGEAMRETSLELGDLLGIQAGDEQEALAGPAEPEFSGIETSLDALELDDELPTVEAPPETIEALDFGDFEADEITLGDADALDALDLEEEDLPDFGDRLENEPPGWAEEPGSALADERAIETVPPERAEELALDAEPVAAFDLEAELDFEPELELTELPLEAPGIEARPDAEPAPDEAPDAGQASVSAPEPELVQLGDEAISRPLFELYLAEARQHVATLKRELGHLRANPTLTPAEPAIRAAHTLAGISGTAHIAAINTLAKALEHAQARFRDSSRAPAAEQTELLARSADTLEAMLAEVEHRGLPLAVPELVEQLDAMPRSDPGIHAPGAAPGQAADAEPAAEQAPALADEFDEQLLPIFLEEAAELQDQLQTAVREWRQSPESGASVASIARLLHTMKGSARMAGAMNLGERVHRLETDLQERRGTPAALIDELEAGLDEISATLDGIALGPAPEAPPAVATPAAAAPQPAPAAAPGAELVTRLAEKDSASLRVRADLVDKFVNEAGEIGIARTRIDGELRTLRRSLLDLTENVIRLRNQLREIEIQAETQLQSRIALSGGEDADFDPLELDRFTRLQELTRMMAESVNDVTTVQHNLLKNLDGAESALNSQARLNRDLQQALMRVRMVPFDSIADRLHRVVRQGAKDMDKRVTLDIRAGNTEIDRSVLERMTAPLEHLLRNSIAHGIEAPAARRAAGKAEIGQITVSLAQEGNEIAIDLNDDGAGLNFDRIRERAIENGLIGADDEADERRLTNLIFMPGFSTATSLSAVSGRGVGMDVVKSETAAVGGRVEVSSRPGKGTSFRIYLPVNLAVTQALLVKAGHRTYAIPSTMVAQVRELKVDQLEALRQARELEWHDQTYAYRYLPRLVGDAESQPEIQRFNWVLLLRAGAQTLALHVDGLRGNQEIVVKNAGPHIARIVGISGATVMGDGEIVLILNPVALASRPDVIAEDDAPVSEREAEAHVPTVMVVDDSLTVRKITGRLLEREGYRVITAKDGVDALERLIETVPDVILSDIEMPRMDGFDLARNIRADLRLKSLPIIMITSRLADKHKEYAREIGVDHYLGKPYQEEELIALIAGYAPLAETA